RLLLPSGFKQNRQCSRPSTHAAASSSASSRKRAPTSWIPSGNPLRPFPAGNVRHGVQAKSQIALKRPSPDEPSPSRSSPASLGRARHEQNHRCGEEIVRLATKPPRRADGLDLGGERKLPARGQDPSRQGWTQFHAVHFVLIGVIPCRLEFEDAAMMVENVRR